MDSTSLQHVSEQGTASVPAGYRAPRQRPLGIVLGIAVSLLLHALLIYGYRFEHRSGRAADEAKQVESLTVWIRPLPVPTPAPVPPTAAIPPHQPALASRPARKPARLAPLAITPAPSDYAAATPVPTPAPAPRDAPQTTVAADPIAPAPPHFDMQAALRTARAVANAPDPERAKTAVGQIPEKPLATETKLARDMAQAKRPDCKDGLPGGLLAPVFLLMEKKGTGCKW